MQKFTKIAIEPVDNGFILEIEWDDEYKKIVFSTVRQVMLYLGQRMREYSGDTE